MFVLAEMKNVTRIPPELFDLKLNDAIAGELNRKLANKVLTLIILNYLDIMRNCLGGFKCWSLYSTLRYN